jgi:(p)ppGpp synthase/HD superfamily hydrolase
LRVVAPEDENLIAAGYLHDTIEDTETTYAELVEAFNRDVADLIMEVTQEGRKDRFGYYFPRLESQRGVTLKFADRLSNLTRMQSWSPKRRAQYLRKSRFWRTAPGQ